MKSRKKIKVIQKSTYKRNRRNSTHRIGNRRTITSNSGKILKPLDVRSQSDISNFLQRITQGPHTIVMVYADWCGHCQTMKPIFDKASYTPNRNCQVVKVKDDMLSDVNASLKSYNSNVKPLEVQGYPTILAVDKNGNTMSEINAVKDLSVMKSVMEIPPQNTNQKTSSQKPIINLSDMTEENAVNTVNTVNTVNAVEPYIEVESKVEPEMEMEMETDYIPSRNQGTNSSSGSIGSLFKKSNNVSQELAVDAVDADVPLQNISPPASISRSTRMSPLTTSTASDNYKNQLDSVYAMSNPNPNPTTGGSLYSTLSQTAYTLAPTALLLATASSVLKTSTRKQGYKKNPKRYSKKYSKKNPKKYSKRY